MNSKAIDKLLNMKQKFDVVIVQQVNNNTECMMGVAWKPQADIIGFNSTYMI